MIAQTLGGAVNRHSEDIAQQPNRPFPISQHYLLLLLLTWAAGSIDVISFIGFNGIFTANMSGNIVLLGLDLGQKKLAVASRIAIALAGYCLGVIVGELIVKRDQKEGIWSKVVTKALILEAILLAVFTLLWYLGGAASQAVAPLLITLAALSMGIQSAAIDHLKIKGITTTYFSGTLTVLLIESVDTLLLRSSSKRGQGPTSTPKVSSHNIGLQISLTVIYAIAAGANGLASGLTGTIWPSLSISFPLIAVLGVILTDLLRRRSP